MSMEYDITREDSKLMLGGVDVGSVLGFIQKLLSPFIALMVLIIFILTIFITVKVRELLRRLEESEVIAKTPEGFRNPTQMSKLVDLPMSGSEAMTGDRPSSFSKLNKMSSKEHLAASPVTEEALREYAFTQ